MAEKFDVTVIGGGPAGYVCAIRLSQLGLKTACIESRGSLGGTCLNIGCIPSKSLLNMSESFHRAKNFSNIGIETGEIKLNLEKMMSNKDSSVATLTKGVEYLNQPFRRHGDEASHCSRCSRCHYRRPPGVRLRQLLRSKGSQAVPRCPGLPQLR